MLVAIMIQRDASPEEDYKLRKCGKQKSWR
jgi:hypothetical protein